MESRKLILYISMSLDGFIATKDDDLSWLSMVQKEGEDYGYEGFTKTIDTYIVGRKTYDIVRELCDGIFPQAEKFDCYVISKEQRPTEKGVTFFNGNIEDLIQELKTHSGKNIYCDGGAQIVKLLMDKDLIDEYIISVIPIILGSGKRLFIGETPGIKLKALPCKYFESGLIQLRYIREI